MCDMSVYSTNMFIFIDETGSDNRNALCKYGYSLRGKTPVNHALLVRGERVSAIVCMSITGLLDIKPLLEPVMETHSMILYTLSYYHT